MGIPVMWYAVPVALIGLASIVVGLGPRRWVRSEQDRAANAPLLHGRLLAHLPRPAFRAFLVMGEPSWSDSQ